MISEVRTRRLHPSGKKIKGILYPAQVSEIKDTVQRRRNYIIDRTVYASRSVIASDTVRIEHLGKIRDNPLSNIIISPVRYNPRTNSLEVITSMKIEITNISRQAVKQQLFHLNQRFLQSHLTNLS